jgi:hypothetical protein
MLAAAAVSLAACGRAGPPEPPPGPAFSSYPPPPAAAPVGAQPSVAQAAPEQAPKTGFDAYGNPIAPPSERKSFFLDFLLQ